MAVVRYRWLEYEEGGRRNLPVGPSLRYPIKLDGDRIDDDGIVWDVEFSFECPPKRGVDQMGTIEYGHERAPRHMLKAGIEFELFEGRNAVVKGTILNE